MRLISTYVRETKLIPLVIEIDAWMKSFLLFIKSAVNYLPANKLKGSRLKFSKTWILSYVRCLSLNNSTIEDRISGREEYLRCAVHVRNLHPFRRTGRLNLRNGYIASGTSDSQKSVLNLVLVSETISKHVLNYEGSNPNRLSAGCRTYKIHHRNGKVQDEAHPMGSTSTQ